MPSTLGDIVPSLLFYFHKVTEDIVPSLGNTDRLADLQANVSMSRFNTR